MLYCAVLLCMDQQVVGADAYHALPRRGAVQQYGWYDPTDLIWNTSSPFYFHEIGVFINATRLTYVSTSGGYYENWTTTESISDEWERSSEYFVNPPFGMRALVFYQPKTYRLLIAYRGTDLTNDFGGLCDRCADSYLWNNVRYQDLPEDCRQFNRSTLDYMSSAMDFANTVARAFPLYDIMYTGHSLGAGLAAVVSSLGNIPLVDCAPVNAGAIVFSPPGYIATLMNRTGVDLGLVDASRIVTLADRWDPVWVGCNASLFGGVMAQVCEWFSGQPSAACVACDSSPSELPLNTSNCQTCIAERHAFYHYEQLRPLSPYCGGPRQECPLVGFQCWTSGDMCALNNNRTTK